MTYPTTHASAANASAAQAGGAQPTDGSEHTEDLNLARQALEGSALACQEFAVRMTCVPRMLAARNARLSHPFSKEDLEDLTQDTLVSIWKRLDSYAGRASLETWAFQFCRHQVANRLRARGRRPRHVSDESIDSTHDVVGQFMDYEEVHQAIDRVESRDAQVIRLKHFDHQTFDQIGNALAISPNTAKSRYYRALNRLRELLSPAPKGLPS